ncbi:S-layer homology domain-containing protein [Sporosarcina sp. FSL W7-1349]|uniref:S-layer homology domain-containing protein n=1 Tax=Sporosarcina sp. FSL W7-1349 TaxID=2921561 RepID=UPI0030FBCB90
MKKGYILGVFFAFVTLTFGILKVDAKAYSFQDVKSESSHYEAINYLSEKGFIGGFRVATNVLEFKPNEPIYRSEAAAMLSSVFDLPVMEKHQAVVDAYKDFDPDHPLILSITSTINEGIFKGEDGYFKDSPMNREQMATIIVRAFGLEVAGNRKSQINLSNVSASHQEAVRILSTSGVTTEITDFRPKETVTRAQFVTFLYRAMKATGLQQYTTNEEKQYENFLFIDYVYTGIYGDSAYIYANNPPSFFKYMNVSKEDYLKGAEYAVAYPNSYILLNKDNEYIHLPQKKEIISRKRTNIPIYSRALSTFSLTDPSEVPIPAGKTLEQLAVEQKAKQAKLKEENQLRHSTYFNLFDKVPEDIIRWRADNIGPARDQRQPMDPYELVELMNRVIETGEVYDGGYYSMHYDFEKGIMHITMREVFFD